MPVLISLVITVYNRERFLGAAIESILTQTQPDFELLVWDDGSTDRSVEIAQNYAQQDSRLRVVVAKHQGRSLALKDAIAFRRVCPRGVDSDFGKPNPPVSFSRREGGVRKLLPPMGKKFGRSLTPDKLTNRIIRTLAKSLSPFLAVLPLLGVITANPALSQVVSDSDSAGTLVNTTGSQFDITGGQTSSNGANLFHSFSQFDLNTGQVANFQPNSTVQNILGRVVSGNASNINGLIQVTGSNANLYLMNPAGIIFGSNASLNIPGSFVATTATSIGMGNNWFNAAGSNDYTQLNDTPNGFAFTTSQPGSIVNSGNLTVSAGKELMLLGGTVVNTGQLNAPSGQITMAAVPGTSLVRLSQPGSVLSLEVLPPASGNNSPTQWTLPVLSLPQLLTGGGGGNATGLSVNADGQAVLTGSGIQIPNEPGSAIASGSLNASGIAPGQIGGTVHVLGNRVSVIDANINASGSNGGGTVLIGGDYQGKGTVPNAYETTVNHNSIINADALVNSDGGKIIAWADHTANIHGILSARGGTVSGNGGFIETSSKQFLNLTSTPNASAFNGSSGTWLIDPTNITIVNGGGGAIGTNTVDVANINTALNSGTSVTITTNIGGTDAGNITQNAGAAINKTAGGDATLSLQAENHISLNDTITSTSNRLNLILNADSEGNGAGAVAINGAISTNGGDITIKGINNNGTFANGMGVSTLASLNSGGGNILINGTSTSTQGYPPASGFDRGINIQGDITSGGGSITLIASNIEQAGIVTFNPINSGGGNISFTVTSLSNNSISIQNPLNSGAGNITLTSDEINLSGAVSGTGNLLLQPFTPSQAIAIAGTADSGTGTLDITTNDLNAIGGGFTSLTIGRSNGSGAITLNPVNFNNPTIIQTSTGAGSITTTPGNIRTNGNNLTLISNLINTSASTIDTSLYYPRGGSISFTAPGGITLGNLIATGSFYYGSTSPGGNITLTGPVTLANTDTSITTGSSNGLGAGNIKFSSTINGTKPGAQALNLTVGTGTVTLGDAVGGVIPLGSLNVTGGNGSQVFVGSNITLDNKNLTFNQPVTLTGNAIFNAGTGTIGFNSSLATGSNALTLTADEINFTGGANSVTGTSNLVLQPFTPTQNIAIAGATDSGTGTLDITTADIAAWQNGFNSITIGGANSSGTINILNPVTFFDPVTIQAPQGAGTINTTGAITGLDNASITLKANQNITTSNITANPGITLISSNGTIDTSGGILDSSSTTANGGVILLSALGNITTNNITSHSDTAAGGDITLNSQTGIINSGNLDASGNTRGGNISVIAQQQITAGQINSSAITGDGGNVLLDPIGDIQVDSINAQGGTSGKGGTVDITTNQFFRAVGNFSDRNGINASISTAGGTGSGDMIIRHDGGARGIPFIVGDTTINGTAGAITTGSANSILPLQFFPGAYTQGNIQIITQNPPPPPTLPPATPSPSPKPDTNRVSKDIQGENLVPQGINTISASAFVLLNTTDIVRQEIDQAIASGQIEKAIALVEQLRMQEFQNHFEGNLTSETNQSGSVEQTQAVLSDIATNTGKTPAVIYVFTQPDQLQLILVTPKDKPLLKTVYEANKDTLFKTAKNFRSQITEPRNKKGYQAAAKQLYQWLVEPLEAELQAKKIDTLVFSMDGGLRSIPMAALYDGKQFLVEKYSIGLIPSINLVDTRYGDVKTSEVLAMGASKFTEQNALPAVPIELLTIVGQQNLGAENRQLLSATQSSSQGLWTGKSFLNQGFTLNNLKVQRDQTPFGVIHLATHGEFNLGAPRNSYIQLSDTKLRLDELRKMGWNKPPVELLVLSACRTALGNEDAEFGFGGLAVAAGVKSAIASLWYVSDEGTLGLITDFYQQLKTAPIKAEALRQAQIAMIKGQVRVEGGKLQGMGGGSSIPLPPELADVGDEEFSHPYYWSAFTLIGSPW